MVQVPTLARCWASPRATPTQNAGGDLKRPCPAGVLLLTSARASGRLVPSVTVQEFMSSAWEHGSDPSPRHSTGPRKTTAACRIADVPRRSLAERHGKVQNHRSPRICRRITSKAVPALDVQLPSERNVSHLNNPNSSCTQPGGQCRNQQQRARCSSRKESVRT